MVVITFMMFTSAATGYAACMAFCRGITGNSKGVGNFYEDVIRITTRILLPFSIVIGILLIWQGVPQTLAGTATVETIEGRLQDIAMGPVAALESIKHLGTNIPMLHMMLNCVFGGKGVGLMNMIMYVILAVFLCGLMIGRTPEVFLRSEESMRQSEHFAQTTYCSYLFLCLLYIFLQHLHFSRHWRLDRSRNISCCGCHNRVKGS